MACKYVPLNDAHIRTPLQHTTNEPYGPPANEMHGILSSTLCHNNIQLIGGFLLHTNQTLNDPPNKKQSHRAYTNVNLITVQL